MNWKFVKRILLLCFLLLLFSIEAIGNQEANSRKIRIGVLAKRGPERCLAKWGPTAGYLTEKVPSYSFEIVPLGYDEIFPRVESGEIDFVLANSSFYVELEMLLGVQRIVTLNNLRLGKAYTVYGGVIFCKAGRDDLKSIGDLRGKRFISLDEKAFASWPAVWREIKDAGIDPYRDFAQLEFKGPMDEVVYAVLNGDADAGSVRTDLLEQMSQEGKIKLEEFYIINEHKSQNEEILFLHSTRVYPEWPLAKLKQTPNDLAEKVAVALISMPSESEAAKSARCAGWTIPLNYQPVHECLKELRIGPYKEYGKITLVAFLRQYGFWVTGFLVILFSIFLFYMYRSNVKLNVSLVEQEKEIVERKRTARQLQLYRNNLEKTVERRTKELTAVNKELEAFAYSVSHDLRAPLRGIDGFSKAMLDEYSDAVDDTGKDYLRRVRAASQRMGQLIEDILSLSRLTRREMHHEDVCLGAIAVKIAERLKESEPDRDVRFVIDPAIICTGDRSLLEIVLENLLGNAWKFTSRHEKACIEFGVKEENGKKIYYVGDDGAGFDMAYSEKLFGAFQRLHGQNEFAGSGIGLATVQRIINRHGGHIWAEGEIGKGAVFYFTL